MTKNGKRLQSLCYDTLFLYSFPTMNTKILISGALLLMSTSAVFAAVGDYKETACTAELTSQSCDVCFTGDKVAPGGQVTGFFDSWTNKNQNEQIIYKDEQTMPEMIALSSGTVFTANPLDPESFWKFGSAVIWTDSATGTGKQEFMLDAGKTVRYIEADLGASYTLTSTDRAGGEVVGVLRFPLNYHNVDTDGNEGKKETITECVAYTADVATAKVTPVETVQPTPEPKKMTTVKTGPGESLVLVAMALLIAAGLVAVRRRKV